jgi:PAS domain S-box-containing protein
MSILFRSQQENILDTHFNLKKKIFQAYCFFRLTFSFFIVVIILRYPENASTYLPALLFSIILPLLAFLSARKYFFPTVIVFMAINFALTTFYVLTVEASNPNALAATLLITYLAQTMLVGFIFRWNFSIVYGGVSYMLVVLKQIGLFESTTLSVLQDYQPVEYILFTGGYIIIIIGFIASNARLVKTMIANLLQQSESLKLAEAKYRSIFENAQDGIFQSTENGQIIIANTSMAKILGYNSAEDLTTSISNVGSQIYHNPDDRVKILQLLKTDGKVTNFEAQVKRKDNEVCWVLANISAITDKSGKLLYLEGLIRDINDKKNTEVILRKRESFIRKMTQNTSEAIVACDEYGTLSFFNKAALEWHGPDMLDKGYEKWADTYGFYDPQRDELLKQDENPLYRAFNNEEVKNIEIIIKTKGQLPRHVLCNGDPIIDDDGKKIGAVMVMYDITERKLYENRLVNQFEELKKTNHELDKFVYSVSHDLRAPITSVQGLIHLAMNETPTPTQEKYLTMIESSIGRMDKFIKEILDYSQNARTSLAQDKINFEQIIDEIKADLQYLDGFEKVDTKVSVNKGSVFYSDRHRIKIFLINLFSNAIKFSDHNKSHSKIEISISITPESAEIIFRDNGIGIEKEQLPKIFNMFHRATDRGKGSGLGLYIAKEIINKLSGSIMADSQVGKYTVFIVSIPNNLKRTITAEFSEN